MDLTDLLRHPPRRDVKGMTALLGELKHGEQVSVTFKSEKYGVYNIHGTATISASVKTFMIGSKFIETNLKPDKSVLAIENQESVLGKLEVPCEADEPEVLQELVNNLCHGDVVQATFERHPHGKFTIRGTAVATDDGAVVAVASWFLAHKGRAAVALRNLTIIAEASSLNLPTPKLITDWESDEEGAGI